MKTWRDQTDPWKTLALAWSQTFLRWGHETCSGDLTWPDPANFFYQNVRNEWLGKVTKFGIDISRRLAMAQEKPEGGAFKAPPPARNRVNWKLLLIGYLVQSILNRMLCGWTWSVHKSIWNHQFNRACLTFLQTLPNFSYFPRTVLVHQCQPFCTWA